LLPDTLIEGDAETNENTLVAVKAATAVDRLAYKLTEAEAETIR